MGYEGAARRQDQDESATLYRALRARDGKFQIDFDEKALFRLATLVRQTRENPSKQQAVGGVLLGSFDANLSLLRIDDFEAVQMERHDDRVVRLSKDDEDPFAKLIETFEIAGGPTPVGHFRSRDLDEPEITADDVVIARTLRNSGTEFMLLIQPWPITSPVVQVYREDRGVNREFLFEFALPEGLPSNAESDILTNRRPQQQNAALVRPPLNRRSPARATVAACIVLGIAGVAWFVFSDRVRTAPASSAPIGLNLAGGPGQWTIRWNPSSIGDGRSGRLTIDAAGRQIQVPLSRGDLRRGTFVYPGINSDATVQLEVFRSAGTETARITVVQAPMEAKVQAPMEATPSEPAPPPLLFPGNRIQPKTLARVIRVPVNAPIHMTQRPIETPTIEPPQALSTVSEPPSPLVGLPQMQTALPLHPSQPIQFTAAVPIRRVQPAVPVTARALLQDDVTLEVHVKVDAAGRVSDATALNLNGMAARLLAPQAVQAAELWQFEPAKVDGKPVASETTVKFHFNRTSR